MGLMLREDPLFWANVVVGTFCIDENNSCQMQTNICDITSK